MKPAQQDYEILDRYHQGILSTEEAAILHEKMEGDAEFKTEANEYLELIGAVKFYGERKTIKNNLDKIHEDILTVKTLSTDQPAASQISIFKKYWRITAVAASVTLAAVIGALVFTQSLEHERTAEFRELRGNIEQIKKSQNKIINDLAESKGATTIAPGKYSGTGFLISKNGYVATSYHVIKESDSVYLENEFFGRLKASTVYTDTQNDIAILKIDSASFVMKGNIPFTISQKEADLGEYVYTLGFPREDVVFGEGSVSASTGYRQNPNSYQVSVPVNPGNSGGPLLNSNGELVGVVSGVQTETEGAAFAIKSTQLLDIINNDAMDSLASNLILPKQNTLRNANRVQQIKKLKGFVFMIRVYKGK
jgi:serine protease Do